MEIVLYPDPVLRRPADPVDPARTDLPEIVGGMLRAMREAKGVGLAAPQVGLSLRLFVASESGDPAEALVCLNPELELSGDPVEMPEGCLSIPGIQADIRRPERVRIRATGLDGQPFELAADGLLARILQHEYDHLNGILFLQRMSESDRMRFRGDLRQLEERYERAQI